MNDPRVNGLDPARSRLRASVAKVERELTVLFTRGVGDAAEAVPAALAAAWTGLVEQLALGPEPEVRECPACGQIGMKSAKICSNCWGKLTPPEESPPA